MTRDSSASRRLALGVALFLAIVFSSACGTPDPALGSPVASAADGPSGSILFVAQGRVMLWDGAVRRVTQDGQAASPAWAPDGQRFAYVQRFDAGYSQLVVADRQGATLRQVAGAAPPGEPYSAAAACVANWVADPAWSPKGDQLAFVSDEGGWEASECQYRVSDPMYLWFSESWNAPPYLLPASANIGETQEGPTFSPDGNQLAFVVRATISDTVRTTQLWAMDLNGGATRTLVDGNAGAAYDAAWAPTSDNIAYIQRTGAADDVWIAPARDGAPYQLTNVGTAVSPTWSPDGRFLAFFKATDGGFEAWYVAVTADASGRLSASEPQKLFTADNIDAPSGMSWANP